jgi:F0F1-type ATP synthase assembly protein I
MIIGFGAGILDIREKKVKSQNKSLWEADFAKMRP